MADKLPLTLNTDGTVEQLRSADSLDIGGYTLPNTAGTSTDILVMGVANAEWASVGTVGALLGLTLDDVCDNGSITDQEITACGIHLLDNSGSSARELAWYPDSVVSNYAYIGGAVLIGQISDKSTVASNDGTDDSLYLYSKGSGAVHVNRYGGGSNGLYVGVSGSSYIKLEPGSIIDSTGTISFGDENLTTTGSIKSAADSAKHYFGASDDYTVEWDGTNAVHTITSGAHKFNGGPIQVVSLNTTQRDALTPGNGMVIYNTTTNTNQTYANGAWSNVAAVIITEETDVYVDTTGNDTTGDGSSGAPWATVDKALEVVGSWSLLADVNINIAGGSYADTDTLTLAMPCGKSISLLGEYEEDTVTLSSTSGSSGNRLFTFATTNTSWYTVNDYVLIHTATGGTNPEYALGTYKVSSVSAGTSVTLQIPSTVAPSGAVSATVSIPLAKFTRVINIQRPFKLVQGIHTVYSAPGSSYALLSLTSVPGVDVNFDHCIWYNSGTARYGILEVKRGNSAYFEHCGTRNMLVGCHVFGATTYSKYSGSTDCKYSVYCAYLGRTGIEDYHCVYCFVGLTAIFMSHVYKDPGSLYLVGNTTDSSPAQSTEGNYNSYMKY